MASLSSLYRQLRTYRDLSDDVQNSIRHLERVIDSSERALKVSDYYLIDEVSADNYKLKNARTTCIDKKNFLSSEVMSAINQKINSILRAIEDEERALAEAAKED